MSIESYINIPDSKCISYDFEKIAKEFANIIRLGT